MGNPPPPIIHGLDMSSLGSLQSKWVLWGLRGVSMGMAGGSGALKAGDSLFLPAKETGKGVRSARQRDAGASSHPAKGLGRLQHPPGSPAGVAGRGWQPGRSPHGSHRAGARSTQVTPQHGKLRAGRQEILVLCPKSFPEQRNGLPGQIAEILTAKLKKTKKQKKPEKTWRNSPKKQRGLGRGLGRMQGCCLGFLSPGKVVAARTRAG